MKRKIRKFISEDNCNRLVKQELLDMVNQTKEKVLKHIWEEAREYQYRFRQIDSNNDDLNYLFTIMQLGKMYRCLHISQRYHEKFREALYILT